MPPTALHKRELRAVIEEPIDYLHINVYWRVVVDPANTTRSSGHKATLSPVATSSTTV